MHHVKTAEFLFYFSSVFTDEDLNTPWPQKPRPLSGEKLTEISITREEVRSKLLNLNTSGAPGPDGLHPRILKELAPLIASPLAHVFRKCLHSSAVPREWRLATIIPVFKKGKRNQASN